MRQRAPQAGVQLVPIILFTREEGLDNETIRDEDTQESMSVE